VAAVAKVQFCVSTPSAGDFDFAASPMTRISAIRKMLEEVDTSTEYDEYWFTLNGMDNLKESRTFWDLDIVSGTMILLSKSLESLSFCCQVISHNFRETLLCHSHYPSSTGYKLD
jgi:hypothetical protein